MMTFLASWTTPVLSASTTTMNIEDWWWNTANLVFTKSAISALSPTMVHESTISKDSMMLKNIMGVQRFPKRDGWLFLKLEECLGDTAYQL
mmetsp:Transcript_20431/g.33847  ORF Transcript_20431/g.33847 Transcript_20431/m.33847 type:complete len:91 (-) Transcript_20431:35-307(-)